MAVAEEPRMDENNTGSRGGANEPRRLLSVVERIARPEFPDVDARGKPKGTNRNAQVAFNHLGIEFSWDTFTDTRFARGDALGEHAGVLDDVQIDRLRQLVLKRLDFDPGRENTYDAARTLCNENAFDPVVDYLDGLPEWDGAPRLETWLHWYVNAEDTPLNSAIGIAMLIAAVRRAKQPGCTFEFMPVFHSDEGTGKTTAVKILCGNDDWLSDQEMVHLHPREQQEALQGRWFVEWGELSGLQSAQVGRVKSFLQRTTDRARPAWGKMRVDLKRRCIFVGTTNEEKFLRGHTGNRRFWPVKVGRVLLDELRADRDQLWAEAVMVERAGTPLNIPEELWPDARAAQEERLEDDPWCDALGDLRGREFVDSAGNRIARLAFKECREALGLSVERQTSATETRMNACMKRLGWRLGGKEHAFKVPQKYGGVAQRGYIRDVTDDA